MMSFEITMAAGMVGVAILAIAIGGMVGKN